MAEPHEETQQEKNTRRAVRRAAHDKEQRGRRTARQRKACATGCSSERSCTRLPGLLGCSSVKRGGLEFSTGHFRQVIVT